MSAASEAISFAESASPKRQAIIDAGADLFMSHGYGQVSMDAVARAAGVSKATLYAHFTSKDQLFASIVGGACSRAAFEDKVFAEHDADVRATLLAIGGRLLRFLIAPGTQAIQRVVIAESARFPELGVAFMKAGPEQFLTRMTAWIETQIAAGRLRADNPRQAADQFGALLRTVMFLRALAMVPPAPDEAEINATVEAAVTTFLRAYGADSPAK